MTMIPMRRSHLVSNAGNRPFSPRFSAAVMVQEIVCNTPGRSSPNDYAVGYLLHSIPGLEAKFAESGQPLTKIVCLHQLPRRAGQPNTPGRGGKTPTDLALLKAGSSQITKHVTWQVVIFENARLESRDPTGQGLPTVKAAYLTAGPTAQERGLRPNPNTGVIHKSKEVLVYPALVMPRKDNGSGRSYQKIALADPQNAVSITNEDALRAAITQRIETTGMGYAGFLLISRQLAPSNYTEDEALSFARETNTRDASICLLSPYPVDQYGRRVEPGSNAQIAGYHRGTLEDALGAIRPEHRAHSLFHPGWQHTLVPLLGFPQSLFSYDKAHDPSAHYRFDESGYGFAQSIVTVTESNNGSGGWVSSFQKPINSCGDIVAPEEIVTADMPAYHRQAAIEMVRHNTAQRLQRAAEAAANYQARNNDQAAPQPGPGYNQGGFGNHAPGHSHPANNWGPGPGQTQGINQGHPQAHQGHHPHDGYDYQQHSQAHYPQRPYQNHAQPQMQHQQHPPQNFPQQGPYPNSGPHQQGGGRPTSQGHFNHPQQRQAQPPANNQRQRPRGGGQGQGGWSQMGPNDDVDVQW